MIKVLVVDDEPVARARLRRLVEAEPDLRLLAECRNSDEALAAIAEHAPDVVFLDVDMPGTNGMDMIAHLPEAGRPLVVFVTAYQEFAVRAFELPAIDYLLKPYDPERFRAALERVRARLAEPVPQVREPERAPERLVVRARDEHVFVNVRDIDWISAADNYVEVHVGARSYFLRETLASVERRLEAASFVRIRRDAIVNGDRVRAVRTGADEDFEIVLHDGTTLRLGRAYRARLTERWQGR